MVQHSDDEYSSMDSPKQLKPVNTPGPVYAGINKGKTNNPAASLNLKLGFMPNPSQSVRSPVPATKGSPESARQAIAGSSTATPSPDLLSSPRKSTTSNAVAKKVQIG